jgi:hypothetical protein
MSDVDHVPVRIGAIPMLLFCPNCGNQHVDKPEPHKGWHNPPHKSHLCHVCETVWRPCDHATVGVAAIETHGERDSWSLNAEGTARPVRIIIVLEKHLRELTTELVDALACGRSLVGIYRLWLKHRAHHHPKPHA